MDLIDRYLVAVRRHLPPALQKDIVEELADSLRSEAEDRAQKAGRMLTDDDQAELLKNHGHPWLMASRYLPQQQLIGPALFPYFRQALVMVVFWVVLPVTLIGGALAAVNAQDTGQMWGHALNAAWNGAIYAVGFVTVVFAILESQQVRITALDNWQPAKLPEPQDGREVPRSESLFNLIVNLTFLMIWIDVIRVPQLAMWGGDEVQFVPSAIWSAVHIPIIVTVLGTIATSCVDLMRPWRTVLFSLLWIANTLAFAAIVVVVLRAEHWIDVVAPGVLHDRATRGDYWINQSIEWGLFVVLAITLFEAIHEMWQLLVARKGRRV